MGDVVFPARAGMSPPCWLIRRSKVGVPRASGDEPAFLRLLNRGRGCSPRERG